MTTAASLVEKYCNNLSCGSTPTHYSCKPIKRNSIHYQCYQACQLHLHKLNYKTARFAPPHSSAEQCIRVWRQHNGGNDEAYRYTSFWDKLFVHMCNGFQVQSLGVQVALVKEGTASRPYQPSHNTFVIQGLYGSLPNHPKLYIGLEHSWLARWAVVKAETIGNSESVVMVWDEESQDIVKHGATALQAVQLCAGTWGSINKCLDRLSSR